MRRWLTADAAVCGGAWVRLERNGKVIVPTSVATEPQIDVLLERGRKNGIRVEKITPEELAEIEPEARTNGFALHSPDTAVVDSGGILGTLVSELDNLGVALMRNSEVLTVDEGNRTLHVRSGPIGYGYLVNAAGLPVDRLAHWVGVGEAYQILPFKSIYRRFRPEKAKRFRGSVYPAPDPRVPFLGVHITPVANGETLIGPTAIPAFGRENYGWLRGVRTGEAAQMLGVLTRLVALNRDGFRRMVREEVGRYRRRGFLAATQALAPSIRIEDILPSSEVGLRAQWVRTDTLELVMDFVLEVGESSLHILNAISPAFTSSFRLAELLADEAESRAG
jgi:L-2-hydroxyglutarate oxidase